MQVRYFLEGGKMSDILKSLYKTRCGAELMCSLSSFSEATYHPSISVRFITLYNKFQSGLSGVLLRFTFALLACLSISNANADLSSTLLEDLIKHSDVIVFAQPIKFESNAYGEGYALFTAKQTIKGIAPPENFRITWTSEVHEQRIKTVNNRLLFLKREANGEYTGTQYGRSYWEIESDFSKNSTCQLYTRYLYPINIIVIDPKYINAGLLIKPHPKKGEKTPPILCLDNIQTIVR